MRALRFDSGLLHDGDVAVLHDDVVDVGRERDNHLVLEHASVSRHHARLELRSGGFVIVDRGSRNGVWVNGKRVSFARIEAGDRVGFGDVLARYVDEDSPHPNGDEPRATTVEASGGDALLAEVRAAFAERYEVAALVGRGMQSTVFRARRSSDDAVVALKILAGVLEPGSVEERRFEREGRALARLRHPAIVPIFESGRLGRHPYIAAPYLGGGTLEGGLGDGGALPIDSVIAIGLRLCLALDHAHGAGVLHRDVKPANVLRSDDGQAVLADFGLVKLLEETSLTDRGVALGTPLYMSPEVFSGERATPQSDVWSLGATLYRCLAGQPPFPGRSVAEIAQRVTSPRVSAVPLPSLRPMVPLALARAVHATLEKDPSRRIGSAQELAARLLE